MNSDAQRIALIDLDGTLFDYDTARHEATLAAFQDMGIPTEDAFHLLKNVLVPYGALLREIGLPDFRRQWNDPRQFALFHVLTENAALSPGNTNALASTLGQLHQNARRHNPLPQSWRHRLHAREHIHDALRNTGLLEHFLAAAECTAEDGSSPFDTLCQEFDQRIRQGSGRFLFPGVDEFLRALREGGIEPILFTEGDAQIQQAKMDLLGLTKRLPARFISANCCQCEALMERLYNIAKTAHPIYSNLSQEHQTALQRLHDSLLPYALKTPLLFQKTVHAVAEPQPRRPESFRHFGWLSKEKRRDMQMSVLVAGDRYDKDIMPALRAFGPNVTTIRLLLGKYRNKFREPKDMKEGPPNAVAGSLSDAEASLTGLIEKGTTERLVDLAPYWNAQWGKQGHYPGNLKQELDTLSADDEVATLLPLDLLTEMCKAHEEVEL